MVEEGKEVGLIVNVSKTKHMVVTRAENSRDTLACEDMCFYTTSQMWVYCQLIMDRVKKWTQWKERYLTFYRFLTSINLEIAGRIKRLRFKFTDTTTKQLMNCLCSLWPYSPSPSSPLFCSKFLFTCFLFS